MCCCVVVLLIACNRGLPLRPLLTTSCSVKNNARTRYFFSDFIQRGDAIAHCRSHQATLSGLLVEHSNLYGLRTKTLWGDDEKLLSKL
jgi:hypothetical protein